MSDHTPGRLTYFESGEAGCYALMDDRHHWLISALHTGEHLEHIQRENLRRLCACWNACQSVSTEDLERYYNTGGGIDEALQEASLRSHVLAVQQRDELLEALKEVLAAVRATSRTPSTSIEAERELDLIRAARKKACAAIAKATGCAN